MAKDLQIQNPHPFSYTYIYIITPLTNTPWHFKPQWQKNNKKNSKFANNVDVDEVAHNEPSHLDLHYLPFSL